MALIVSTLLFTFSLLLLWSAVVADRQVAKPSLFSPLTFTTLLFVLGYVWRPLLHLMDPDRYSAYPEALASFNPEIVVSLIIASAVGIASLHLGYRANIGPKLAAGLPELDWRDARLNLVLFVGVGLVSAYALWSIVGSLTALRAFDTSVRQSIMSDFQGNGPIFFFLFNMPTFSTICLLIYIANRRSSPITAKALFLLAAVFYVGGFFFTVISASRAPLIAVILLPLLIRHYFVKRISFGVQAAIMLVLLLGAGIVGLLMQSPLAAAAGPDVSMGNVVARLSGTLDQFELLYIAITQSKTFLFGRSYLEDVVLTFVPRALFPSKPEIFGTVLLQNLLIPSRFEIAGLSATYPVGFFAEAYMNFGPIGFLAVPFAFGTLLRVLAEKAIAAPSPYAVLLITSLAGTVGVLRSLGGQLASMAFLLIIMMLFAHVRWQRSK